MWLFHRVHFDLEFWTAAFLSLQKLIQWKLSQIKLHRKLQVIVELDPDHVLHVEFKPLQCKYQDFREVLDKRSFDNRSFLVQFLAVYFIVQSLRPKEVYQSFIEWPPALDIQSYIVEVLLLVFFEYFSLLFLRKVCQFLGVAASENRIDDRFSIARLNVVQQRHQELFNVLLDRWNDLLSVKFNLLYHWPYVDCVLRWHVQLHKRMVQFEKTWLSRQS